MISNRLLQNCLVQRFLCYSLITSSFWTLRWNLLVPQNYLHILVWKAVKSWVKCCVSPPQMFHAGEFSPPKLCLGFSLGFSPPNLGSSPPRKSSPTLSFDQLPTLCQAAWTRWKWGFIGLFSTSASQERVILGYLTVSTIACLPWGSSCSNQNSKVYPYIFIRQVWLRSAKTDNIISSTCHCQSEWPDFFDIHQNWWESASGENFLLHWFWSNFKTGFTGNIAQPLSFQSLRDW